MSMTLWIFNIFMMEADIHKKNLRSSLNGVFLHGYLVKSKIVYKSMVMKKFFPFSIPRQ